MFHKDSELSDLQIKKLAKKNKIQLDGVHRKHEISKKPGKFILNLDSEGGGTHWVALNIHHKPHCCDNTYFDSFGLPPPTGVLELWPEIKFNADRIQAIRSEGCGWYCLYFISGKPMDVFETDQDELWKNDQIVFHAIKQ